MVSSRTGWLVQEYGALRPSPVLMPVARVSTFLSLVPTTIIEPIFVLPASTLRKMPAA